jgi:hypothetical protein
MDKIKLVASICMGLSSIVSFTNYFANPKFERIDLLKGTSAQIQNYSEENPKESWDSAQRTLQYLAQLNPQISEISELEQKVSRVNEEIKDSKNVNLYRPILEGIRGEMDNTIAYQTRIEKAWILATLWGIASVLGFGSVYSERKRKRREDLELRGTYSRGSWYKESADSSQESSEPESICLRRISENCRKDPHKISLN